MKVFILTFSILILYSCSSDKIENKIKVNFNKVSIIGKESGNEDEIIGLPTDACVDKLGNIYISDFAFKKVKKFSAEGDFLSSFGIGEGRAPGEFLEPRGIDVDTNCNVYVVDMKQRRITIFDSNSNIINTVNTNMQPTFVQAFSQNSFYLVGFLDTYTDSIIYKYNFENNNSYSIKKICSRVNNDNQFEIENSGFSPRILKVLGNKNYLLESDYYPYSIKCYNLEDEKLYELNRDVTFFKPPYIKSEKPLYVFPSSGSYGIAMLSNNILINYIFYIDEEEKEINSYLDFWDLDRREFLGSFSQEEIGIKLGRYIFTDNKGFFYNYENEPYPHFVKYKVNIYKP